MGLSPEKIPTSPALRTRSYDKEDLFIAYEEREAFARFKSVLDVSTGTYVTGGVTRAAQDARIRGIAKACASSLVHRALNGKSRAAGLASIADVSTAFEAELVRLYDLYNKNSGGKRE